MLFNSYVFIFAFLPAVFIAHRFVSRRSSRAAVILLAAASVVFYGWWDIGNVPIILVSMSFNFAAGAVLLRTKGARGHAVLAAAILANLALLGYFKYFDFLLSVAQGRAFLPSVHHIPLGISFFTFTQIAYLVDTHQGKAEERDPLAYALFVTWFPHLLAGPLLHHKEMMPQFGAERPLLDRRAMAAAGFTLFCLGLAKKVLLADSVGWYVAPTNALSPFTKAASGIDIPFVEAWAGALAYTCQLYFDFSAYSDMAIGCSAMFGIRLPLNFASPYKAATITEFWRRWHMTLSRFLRDYVYIPLGGNRRFTLLNVWTTMVVGGVWHGAGWTFFFWGVLHGTAIVVHRVWTKVRAMTALGRIPSSGATRFGAHALTFLVVVVGWVLFRADTMDAATIMLRGMVGLNGFSLSTEDAKWLGALAPLASDAGLVFVERAAQPVGPMLGWAFALLAIAFFAPNTQQMLADHPIWLEMKGYPSPAPAPRLLRVRLGVVWGCVVGLLLVVSVLGLARPTQFLYFQF
jgi:D-alanyl-lipoteichoic acid acyltransferase DltB (MBOAT superfamily)